MWIIKNIFDFPQRVLPRHDFFFSHSSGSFSSAAFPEDEKKNRWGVKEAAVSTNSRSTLVFVVTTNLGSSSVGRQRFGAVHRSQLWLTAPNSPVYIRQYPGQLHLPAGCCTAPVLAEKFRVREKFLTVAFCFLAGKHRRVFCGNYKWGKLVNPTEN